MGSSGFHWSGGAQLTAVSRFSVVIPARMASSRVPGKPLADLAGKPMVVRVAEQAQRSQAARVIVATDHMDIVTACQQYGVESCLTQDGHATGTDRLAEVASLLDWNDHEIVINVQGDEPLMDPALINQLGLHMAVTQAPVATAAHPFTHTADMFNPNVVKVVLNCHSQALYFSRAPIPYMRDVFAQPLDADYLLEGLPILRHIGIYAYRAGFLKAYNQLSPAAIECVEALEQLRILWHGYAITVLIVDQAPPASVDTPEDLERVRQILSRSQ